MSVYYGLSAKSAFSVLYTPFSAPAPPAKFIFDHFSSSFKNPAASKTVNHIPVQETEAERVYRVTSDPAFFRSTSSTDDDVDEEEFEHQELLDELEGYFWNDFLQRQSDTAMDVDTSIEASATQTKFSSSPSVGSATATRAAVTGFTEGPDVVPMDVDVEMSDASDNSQDDPLEYLFDEELMKQYEANLPAVPTIEITRPDNCNTHGRMRKVDAYAKRVSASIHERARLQSGERGRSRTPRASFGAF